MPVSATQLSVLRMVPIAKRAAHVGHGRLAVLRLLNAVRGVIALAPWLSGSEPADRLTGTPTLIVHSNELAWRARDEPGEFAV